MSEPYAPLLDYQMPQTTRKGEMVYRTLGHTGEQVSLIGMGGFHIGKQQDEQESVKLIRTAIDRGINFMDNSWDYNEGASEIRMGKALQNGYRSKVFLMSKYDGRTKESATQQLEESLRRLQTDRLDLWQFHENIRMEDPDRFFAKGGALEAVLAAKQAGKIRYIGFTGHKDPLVHLRMLEMAAKHGFRFDTVQMPINVMDAHFRSFTHQVVPELMKQRIGLLAMKTFGDHHILDHVLQTGLATPIEMLHYSMSLPTSVVITGMDNMGVLNQAFEAARTFESMSSSQMTALLNKTRTAAFEGAYEPFKTTPQFDSTAMNPQWLG
ncbi:MAG: NADP-dependent oxidoreductase domain protein [Chthonomonadaceae bacterium]|nr:NADP-dependent oxidoreductase domain protein [Chthonomonadaceae bacterium]